MRRSATPASWDGRWVTAAILCSFFLLLGLGSLLLNRPLFELPPFSWLGPMAPYFADLRGVVAGTERLRAGIPPMTPDFHDPWMRPYNYPWWWLYTDRLGLQMKTVMGFGIGMALLFFVSAFYVLGSLSAFEGLVAGLFLISCDVMFGIERANVDLVIFCLITLALGLRRFLPLSSTVMGLAAILKLYPAMAFAALLTPPWRKSLPWIGMGLLFFVIGESDHFHDFLTAMSHSPNMRTGVLSFGSTSWGLVLMDRFGRNDLDHVVFIIGTVTLLLAVGVGAWIRPQVELKPEWERQVFAFRLGAGLYLGAFALGTNHDYRAVFFLFCLPLLFLFLKEKEGRRRWGVATLTLILVYVNWELLAGESNLGLFLLKQGIAWILVVCVAGIAVALLPAVIRWPRREGIDFPLDSRLPSG
jgi:hypothetical protein